MDHSYFRDRVSAYMDQNLPAMEQELLTHHVEKELCPECNRLLQELRAVDGMVSKHSGLSELSLIHI